MGPRPDNAVPTEGTPPTWRLVTPASRAGAVAVAQVLGDADVALRRAGIEPVATGQMRLRELAGVDRGVVTGVTDRLTLLMPHGGVEVVRQLLAALTAAGIGRETRDDALTRYPEARSPFEAELLDALARAVSPLAIDMLLAQPARWRARLGREPGIGEPDPDPARSAALGRLIDPPLVVALGASNIGKSTLLNRLSGREVVGVADEPGTTRDYLGSLVDLDGLVVRWADTPGLRDDAPPSERAAAELALGLADRADLVLLLGDADHPPPEPRGLPSMTLALRSDLGVPDWPHDLAVSARTGDGIAGLVRALRRALVPDEALESIDPWRFWGGPREG